MLMSKEYWLELRKNPGLSFQAAHAYWQEIKPVEWPEMEFEPFCKKFIEYMNLGRPTQGGMRTEKIWNVDVANQKIREYYDNQFNIGAVPESGDNNRGTLPTGEPLS
jgi:hypothetical protein